MTEDTTLETGWVDLDTIEQQLAEISPAPWGLRPCSHGGIVLQRFAPQTNDIQIVPVEDADAIVAWRNHSPGGAARIGPGREGARRL